MFLHVQLFCEFYIYILLYTTLNFPLAIFISEIVVLNC